MTRSDHRAPTASLPRRRRTAALALAIAALFATGADTVTADPAVLEMHRPPGDYILLDTHRQYIYCEGTGSPTVLFEAGLGGASLEWYPVHERVAKRTRACLYDRAGYGWSDNGPLPRDVDQILSELETLLERSGQRPPFLLVGHSFGGLVMQYFAAKRSEAVSGLVLVDSSHPDQFERIAPLFKDGEKAGRFRNPIKMPANKDYGGLPESLRDQAQFMNTRRKAIFTQMDELREFRHSAEIVAAADVPAQVPVIVLARDDTAGADPAPAVRQREGVWRELQEDLASRFDAANFRGITGAGHNLHLDAPEAVVEAIFELLDDTAGASLAQASARAAAGPDR